MAQLSNLLGREKSPYLRQHADNPVAWWPWGEEAFAEARKRNCPVLLSIGYAACHWCHVMAHESFENVETAALMNRLFVNIKVDREERPDVDHVFMSALHALGEQGGWPLTMFLLPDGSPFWGGTYFPPEPRWGRPSFHQVLTAVSAAHGARDPSLRVNAESIATALAHTFSPRPGTSEDAPIGTVARQILGMVDAIKGGLRGAPKFPNAPMFRLLWQFGEACGDRTATAATHRLLEAMSAGGIYDALAGGYARYATDEDWLVPHFEKMLYDNAQILELLAFTHADRPDPVFEERAAETVRWLIREMMVEGAFAASLDADSEGEEGKFYVWSAREVADLLGPASGVAKAYDVRPAGNWEGKTILHRVTPRGSPVEEKQLADQRDVLLAHRERRTRPGRDEKVLADWNGLAVVALVRAAGVFGRRDWLDLARSVDENVRRLLGRPDGRVDHAWCDGLVTASGLLDDQASVARAALALYTATSDARHLAQATDLANAAISWFGDDSGGFFMTASDAFSPAGPRPRQASDGPSPSGVGMIAEVFARLYHLTGVERWREMGQKTSSAWFGAGRALVGMPTLLASADLLDNGLTVAVTPGEGQEDLEHVVLTHPNPRIILMPPSAILGGSHPASDALGQPTSRSRSVVCGRGLCSPPVDNAPALAELLDIRGRSA